MKPLECYMNQANSDPDSPDPLFCGAIYLSQPPQQIHRLVATCSPPLLSDRAGGWEHRSIVMGTRLDSFQSHSATRSRPPVPQATISGKRDSSSVAAHWLPYFFVSRNDQQKFRLLNQNTFHASTNTTSYVKLRFHSGRRSSTYIIELRAIYEHLRQQQKEQ